MDKLDLEVKFVQGLRVTDEATMELAKMVLLGKVNKEVVSLINRHGVPAVGLGGDDGRLVMATKRNVVDEEGQGVDIGQVGSISKINTDVLDSLGRDFIPVVASVGTDDQGSSYNINADEVAAELAVALKAEKIAFLTDVEGLYTKMDDPDSLITQCSIDCIEDMLSGENISKGMIPKLNAIKRAVDGGVHSAHIIDGRTPHALLLEVFTRRGIGTKVE
jgi:acetylglutamate kinase